MITINMFSKADTVQGHGVLTAHDEQVELVRRELDDLFTVYENAGGGCDINHFHTINFSYFLRLPLLKRRGATVGYVHFLPETLEKSLTLPLGIREIFYWYVIRFYKSMDSLVVVNPSFIDKLCAYGVPRSRITYIPNFVSPEHFHRLPQLDKNAAKASFGIPGDAFTVLAVGQLQKRKGVLEFLEVAKALPQVQFVWAGGFSFGKLSDGYEEIRAALENPPANVRFLGMVPRERMNELYNLSDLMFQPSFEELFPMTILEAMSCGVPLLLRDNPEYRPILQGYYLKGSSTATFKRCIEELQQPEQYETACQMSRQGSSFYTRERVRELWRDYYFAVYAESLTREHSPARALRKLAFK